MAAHNAERTNTPGELFVMVKSVTMNDEISVLQIFLEAKEWMLFSEYQYWTQLTNVTNEQWVANRAAYARNALSCVRQLKRHAKNPRYTIARYYNWLTKQKELECQRQRSLPLVDSQILSENWSDTPIAWEQQPKRKRGRPRKNISWTLPS